LRPPVACGLEAKQLGPQFYWSFSFGDALSLLRGHNKLLSLFLGSLKIVINDYVPYRVSFRTNQLVKCPMVMVQQEGWK